MEGFIKKRIGIPFLFLLAIFSSYTSPAYLMKNVNDFHLRDYVRIIEETTTGEQIELDNEAIQAVIDNKSIVRVIFDKEKLFEVLKTPVQEEEEERKIHLRVEAYVKPEKEEKYPLTIEGYTTVIKKTELTQEEVPVAVGYTLPLEQARIIRLTRVEYEICYYEKILQFTNLEKRSLEASLPDTYLDLSSLNLKEGDRVYLTILDIKNNQHISKVLRIKKFGVQVYPITPIMLTYRLSPEKEVMLAPSPGATLVFKIVRRRETLFENWLHPGINIAFLDFDDKQSIELGVGPTLTIYRDFFEIGYGINLSVRKDRQYWYLGLNAIQLPGKK